MGHYVGIDLHRRRSVIVVLDDDGEEVWAGWYWAADVIAEAGGLVHLAHPLGIAGSANRRVKNDMRDATPVWPICCGWGGCPRRGSPHRRPASCASWCATGASWSGCAPG